MWLDICMHDPTVITILHTEYPMPEKIFESVVVSMANMLDNVAVRSIAKHRNKLMSLVESTKKRKKKKQKTWAVPPSNIEHLVFKKIPTSPIDPGPNFNGLHYCEDTPVQDEYDGDDPEDSYDELDILTQSERLPGSPFCPLGRIAFGFNFQRKLFIFERVCCAVYEASMCICFRLSSVSFGFPFKEVVVSLLPKLMLLCVAGGSGAEFRRDRPQAGSRCSSQSFLIKSNANQQVMVEERCSMTSSAASNDHVAARATLSLHLKSNKVPHSCSKESSVAYKSRVIVVSGEGAALGSCSDKGETCSTTTTFKSNVVNGKRGTNTILVRYKPSKPVSEDSDDELQFEFSSKARSSSPSSESSSIKKSISAWAQIMELEGYRSPAVGLDNGPSKRVSSESDSISNFSSLSAESYRSEPSESSYERQTGDEGRFRKHNIISIASKCAPSTVNDSAESCADSSKNRYMKNISLNPDGSNQLHILSMRSKGFVPNRYSDTVSNSVSSNDISGMPQTLSKMPPKCKSSMYRSESSRVTKIPSQEKHKYRRKTLPDGTLSLNASAAPLNKPASVAKNQKSPEHDPNASWGRYNSRAMRDSVRKVAEKYAETVYLRRQTRSQLDSLPESKRVPMTGCIVHSNDHDHPHVSKRELLSENHLYLSKRANSTSHLHEIPSEKESSSRNRLHFVMPASLRHDHSSMHAINNCLKAEVHYKPKYGEMNQDQEEEANFILSENSRLNSSIDEDSLNSVDVSKLLSLDFNYENAQSSYFEKDANEIFDGEFGNNNNLQEDRCRGVLPRTKKYQTSNPLKSSQSISSIECRISSAETKPFQVSFRMQDVKSKLCADCAQSAELGPPNKQSACRARHHLSDACSHKDVMISQISLLKRAPLVIDEGDSSPPLYLRPANSKFNSGTRKCTMLTAREMEELVHGKESADTKLNQTSVTSKVSNWIQKQKDKRKPVFFIGDAPAFYNEKVNESNLGTNSKYSSHKSRRSLSLSSVREGETSISISDRPDNTSDLSSFANGEEMLLKPNEHKGLFIKRTSSSCSNRGSIRRKGRQGSPAREEKETIKNHHCQHNQVDESITSWGNRIHRKPKNCCHKELITTNDLSYRNNTESLVQSEGNHNDSETSQQKCSTFRKNIQQSNSSPKASGKKCFYSSEALNLHVANNSLIYGDPSLLGGQGSRHSYSVISTPNSDLSELARPERSSTAKKLLNFKQITRALSLHSLKKKTREVPMCSNVAAQVPVISLSKWSRGSKRKIENMKYGSLRKSISYCELTARGAKVSGKLDFPIKSLNKTKAPVQKPPTKPPSCACASSLRRSVSLYWQFPLQKTQEYAIENPKSDLLAKICFSRLHRRNTLLPFLREVKNKKSETNEVSKHHYLNGETRNTLLDYKQQSTSRPLILKHEKKTVSIVNELESPQSALNGDKDLQEESGIIMGLGRNYILNEIDSSSNLSVLEEYLPATSDGKLMNNKVPVSMNKNKTPIVLRLQNKTSRSERYAKGRSASEIWSKNDQKSSSNKKRPSSQFYDIEEFELKSENEPNLGQISNIVSCSQPSLCAVDQISNIPQSSSGLVNRHLPLHTSTPQLTPADSLLQRFRKSFAIRFKKKTETTSNIGTLKPSTDLVSNSKDLVDTPKEKLSCNNFITIDQSQSKPANICDKKTSPSVRRRDLSLTYSTCRKRNRRKTDWRTSLFCDSVDSVFDTANKLCVDKCRMDGKQDLRTPPDTANSDDQQKNLTSLDQIWRANPVKLCRVHSRLLMCRHKGRYRLRRSISQPVELEMSGSVHNLRESTHGSADHDSFQKGSLSSEDEASSESDIYHSYCCSPTRRSNTCWELSADGTMYAEALWDHETLDSEELPFQAGDIIEVTDTSDQDWWWGTKDGQGGWFPSAFVRLYVSHRGPSLHFNGQQSDGIQIPYSPCKVSMNNLSCEQVRANIVQEIVATERDYVKHLKDVVEGYLKQVHRRPDMFSKERIETVFGNIKEIYTFQSQFLKELEDCLDKESPHLSQIGNCFLNHACRLLQEMIDISLDGFLLTPIQRICKYPLQLAELLKFTDENHPDHVPVSNALSAMKEVAELVNERKRRMECLERLAEWQSTIEGWEGPDVLDTSSVLIHCGEVTRVSSSWSRDIYLFLFDHQLIYCKKDLLKRHTYAYKGRLNLDHCDIVDVEDGKDSQFAVNVKNAWKIYCKDKEKWYLFYAKTFPEKEQWLRAFKAERQRVNDDEKQAFVVTEEAKRSARLAVHNKHKPKRPRAKFTKGRRCHPDVAVTELLLDSPNAKSRSGSLPSNIHPELAIMAGAKLGPTRKKGSGWFHFGSGKKPKS
ncbi:unnamed protein product [Larinioides sclopetarius]|uniref:Uncharacterized protein n=2 Tax=Larinioides sclopetarius TaxID=280406 RepID=A0AAV2AAU0_9ARAC